MLIGHTSHANGDGLFLGLSKGNLDKLRKGQPIHFLLADRIGIQASAVFRNPTITIVYGETEAAIYRELKLAGIQIGEIRTLENGDDSP